jgi:CRP-like cAMP-binding protein
MADLRKLKDEAAELATKGRLEKAASLYREVLRDDPTDVGSRRALAEVLRRAGHLAEATAAYHAVAERFARDGLLVKAIAISRVILELDPAHVETQAALADLYAKAAPPASGGRGSAGDTGGEQRGGALLAPAPRAASAGEPPDADELPLELAARGPTALDDILLAARAAHERGVEPDLDGEDGVGPAEPPETASPVGEHDEPLAPRTALGLPRVAIFSDLHRDAFVALTAAMALRRVRAGEVVLEEGDTGTSFYVVAAGSLTVSKRDERRDVVRLARLGEGDFFGEMALLSGSPRAATVTADEPAELLEFRAEALREVAGRHPQLAASLRRFYRQRLLANAMAVSALFRPFGREDRKLLMERFRARVVRRGEVVVREGEPSDGLYVVLSGAADVVKRRAGAPVVIGQLREGDLFGEMSCLRKTPATASVVVGRAGTLLRLPRAEFDDLVVSYPRILELVAELTEERAESLDAILSGHARWVEDGLVLV